MMPVLFRIPFLDRDVPGYGFMLMIGFLLAVVWAARRATRSGANPDIILNCAFIGLIGGVLGSRIMYVIHYWEQFETRGGPLDIAFAVINLTKGGLEFYGGFILASLSVLFYLWRWGHSIRWYMDIMAPSVALGMAIGRIGCFLNGCCFGGTCDLPWAVRFPFGSNPQFTQWVDRKAGAELPQQLLFTDEDLVFRVGKSGIPLSRELFTVDDHKLTQQRKQLRQWRTRKSELQDQLASTLDGLDRRKIRKAIHDIEQEERTWRASNGEVALIISQLERYDLALPELQSLARQHGSLPVHPTQLYMTLTSGLLALVLSALYWRRTRDGQVILTLILVEPLARWMTEIIRADNPHDTLGAFTISQFLAICLSLVGLIGLIALRKLPPRSPHARIWVPEQDQNAGKDDPGSGNSTPQPAK